MAARTTYTVDVADVVRYDQDGQPVRQLMLQGEKLTVDEVTAAVARGASVTCRLCGEPWDWCPRLYDRVGLRLEPVRAELVAAFEAAGLPVPPVCRSRPEPSAGLHHEDGLVVFGG